MTKFTFKVHHPTGRYKAFETSYFDILLMSKRIGEIIKIEGQWIVRFKVMKSTKDLAQSDNNVNCKWKWIQMQYRTADSKLAKKYANHVKALIEDKYQLH